MLWNLRSRYQLIHFLERARFLACRWSPSQRLHTAERKPSSFLVFILIRALISSGGFYPLTSSNSISHMPPLQMSSHWGLGPQHMNLGGGWSQTFSPRHKTNYLNLETLWLPLSKVSFFFFCFLFLSILWFPTAISGNHLIWCPWRTHFSLREGILCMFG